MKAALTVRRQPSPSWAKLEHLCRKLRLKPGQRLLDIGCGWGALIVRAARCHGVRAHGITLSRNQYEYVRHRIAREGLTDRVTVELKDYAELDGAGAYDRIVSVGMFTLVSCVTPAAGRSVPECTRRAKIGAPRALQRGRAVRRLIGIKHRAIWARAGWTCTLVTPFKIGSSGTRVGGIEGLIGLQPVWQRGLAAAQA